MKKRSLMIGCLVALGGLATTPARSQPAPAGVEASQKADEFFRAGKVAYKAGKLRESYEAYRSAWNLKRTYDIAANLANGELQLGMKRDAAEHYAFCVRNFPPTGGAAQREKTQRHFEEARQEVGALALKVNVDGAEVLVDGHTMGRTPIAEEVYVEPGARVVEVRLAGYTAATQTVQAAKGATQVVTVALAAVVTPPAAASTSVAEPGVEAGAIQAGAPEPAIAPTAPPNVGRPPMALMVTGGVLSVGGLAAGIVLTVAANGKGNEANAVRAKLPNHSACYAGGAGSTNCKTLNDALGADSALSKGAVAGFVIGGLFGLATAALGAGLTPRASKQGDAKTERVTLHLLPVVTGRENGVTVVGRW